MGQHKEVFRFKDLYRFEGFNFREAFIEVDTILVTLRRCRKTGTCPCCGKRTSRIHSRRQRRIRDLDVATSKVYLDFPTYEIECRCGYEGWEALSFCDDYSRYTTRFEERVVIFCTKMTIKDAAAEMRISWNAAKNIDKKNIRKYLVPLDEVIPRRIGVDEIAYQIGQNYLTVVRDVDLKKVIWVGEGRRKETLDEFFTTLGMEKSWNIMVAVLDMWDPYIASIRAHTDATLVFDKFHIAKAISSAIDDVRRHEFSKADDTERKMMKHKRFLILARQERLNPTEKETLTDLLRLNNTLYKAYLLKEQLLDIFDEENSTAAEKRLRTWVDNINTAAIAPLVSVAKTIQHYWQGILNYFTHRITNAQSEGFNNKINILKRRAYGFKDLDYFKLKIMQACGITSSK